MKFFWPNQSKNWKETIESIITAKPLSPFHPEVLSFLQSISKAILKDHSYRRYPELVALAYWLRKAHLSEMQESYVKKAGERMVLARGTALHFAPSNVDTIFVYSWVLSMLAGNSNILRISGRKQEQTELLLRAIINGLEDYPEVASRTAILTYEHNNETTQYLSERCHIRVIWGGDETVKAIRSIPLAPLATELAFPDRFSLSVLEAGAVLNADDHEFNGLIKNFYNDGFWFAQMACSSPRLIVWTGEEKSIESAQDRFWTQLNSYLDEHLEEYSPALQVQKLTTGYSLSDKESVVNFLHLPNFSRLKVNNIDLDIRERHCGGGLFVELDLPQLYDLIPFLDDKDQTLSYFGFTKSQLMEFAEGVGNRSIDRIVPIGQALDFEGIWDGYDLLMHFTREIVIR
ncbi:acyl-CoA reductase [Cytobacillus firmus]|uniref:acyl-CoA reductase n=1 Tax=Cytobacillus firmus TaxID=1399 RepID=UPI00218AC1D6|nr:acyl-CoA reductase [Cytobacillus firmus]URM33473.1 acyl-CoA reductase [Cytobacillus firmus]